MRITNLGKKFVLISQALVVAFGFSAFSIATTVITAGPSYAAVGNCDPANSTDPITAGASCSQAAGTKDNLFAVGGIFQIAANTLIFLVGAIAVIYLILGGLRYVVSNGDSKAVEGAKNTILYAIVGIVVAVVSFALVQFVISSLAKAN